VCGLSFRSPPRGRRGGNPRRWDCAGVSMTRGVAVVMALLFGRVDGVERAAGDPSVDGTSTKAAPGLRLGLGSRSGVDMGCDTYMA
jgi:hypothetical protein